MKKRSKKGFTLIELMIVLAVIAILAVVLIPKAGALKNGAKDTGLAANVNSVRSFLETKVADSTYLASGTGATKTLTGLNATFTGTNAIQNPYTKNTAMNVVASNSLTADAADSVAVFDSTGVSGSSTVASYSSTKPTSIASNKGIVYVYVCTDGFVIFAVDSNGTVVSQTTVQ